MSDDKSPRGNGSGAPGGDDKDEVPWRRRGRRRVCRFCADKDATIDYKGGIYYLLDTTDDGEDRSLLVVQDSLAEAVEYWRGYYELDANDTRHRKSTKLMTLNTTNIHQFSARFDELTIFALGTAVRRGG